MSADNLLHVLATTEGGTKPGQNTQFRHGLLTPEATPEPDKGRLQTNAEDSSSNDKSSIESENEVKQTQAREILGINEGYDSAKAEQGAISDALFLFGEKAKDDPANEAAQLAYKEAEGAAKVLNLSDEDLHQIQGTLAGLFSDLPDDPMDTDDSLTPPSKIVQDFYAQAMPHLNALKGGARLTTVSPQLDTINEAIRTQNRTEGIEPEDKWTIDYKQLHTHYDNAYGAQKRLTAKFQVERQKDKLRKIHEDLASIIETHHYDTAWNIKDPNQTDEQPATGSQMPPPPAGLGSASTGEAGPSTGEAGPSTGEAGPSTGEAGPLTGQAGPSTGQASPLTGEVGPSTGQASPLTGQAGPSTGEVSPSTGQAGSSTGQAGSSTEKNGLLPPASRLAVQKIQAETLKYWLSMGWTTLKMSNGDTILACKALSRMGREPYGYEFTIMTNEAPYFTVKTGTEVGGEEKEYLKLSGIYQIKTDPGADAPVYTYRYREKYERLLWSATKPRKQTTAGKTPRTGDTQCCVIWKDGTVSQMSRANFSKVSTENEKRAIEKYCRSVAVQAPWEMDPKSIVLPADSAMGKQLLQAGRTGSFVSFGTGLPTAAIQGTATGDVATLQSAVDSLQATVKALDSKFEANNDSIMKLMLQQQSQMAEQQKVQRELQEAILKIAARLN